MIRVDRAELTRNEIIRVAANRFLNEGYSKTTIHGMSKALNMSSGNLTFHYPTKEHLLVALVQMLCEFQWKLLEEEIEEGYSAIAAVCLELLSIASACEQDEIAKDFFLSSYRSQMCIEQIRKNDKKRAMEVFQEFCPHWTEEQFEEAETLVSGIEYATLVTTADSATLEMRISGALNAILGIYNVPQEIRAQNIEKVLKMDYRKFGRRVLKEFRQFVDKTTQQALMDLVRPRTDNANTPKEETL